MSQREFMIVLAHAHVCTACRGQLLARGVAALTSRPLTNMEKDTLTALKFDDFVTPETLSRAAGVTMSDLDAYRDEPVVRLRHL